MLFGRMPADSRYDMYEAPLKYRTTPFFFSSCLPRSLMLSTSLYFDGSYMITNGDWSFSANTAVVGSLPENCTASSVET